MPVLDPCHLSGMTHSSGSVRILDLEFASRLFQNIDYLDHSEDYLDESILWPYEQYEWLFVLQGSIFPMVSRTPQAKSNYLSSRMAESPLWL